MPLQSLHSQGIYLVLVEEKVLPGYPQEERCEWRWSFRNNLNFPYNFYLEESNKNQEYNQYYYYYC